MPPAAGAVLPKALAGTRRFTLAFVVVVEETGAEEDVGCSTAGREEGRGAG